MKTITLKDGTVFEIESYSFGNYGALILIIKSTMQEIFMKFTKESASEIVADIGKEDDELHKKAEDLLVQVKKVYSQVGNLVHESVPISNNENDNTVVKLWGEPDKNRRIDDTVGKRNG